MHKHCTCIQKSQLIKCPKLISRQFVNAFTGMNDEGVPMRSSLACCLKIASKRQ